MEAVDTNVLIRILIDDPGESQQVQRARNFAKKAKRLFVPQIVQVELVWVLEKAYSFKRVAIVPILEHLGENEAYRLQNLEEFLEALHQYRNTHSNFSDCLILAEAEKLRLTLYTFDKKFSRLSGVKIIEDTNFEARV